MASPLRVPVESARHVPTSLRFRHVLAAGLLGFAVGFLVVTPSSALGMGTGYGRVIPLIVSGFSHTCQLRVAEVKCWGNNASGQLGLGDAVNRGDNPNEMGGALPLVDLSDNPVNGLAAGENHTCALFTSGAVKCWGANDQGQLGLGDTVNRGDKPNQMGVNLPFVNLGTGRTALAIAAGRFQTCAILDDHSLKCWGGNLWGQLGLGDTNNRGDNPGEMGDQLPAVSLGTGRTAFAVATGPFHTCALLDNASIKCWGNNAVGALGLGDSVDRGGMAGQMGDNLPSVLLGAAGTAGASAIAVSVGTESTCALLMTRYIKCWGGNDWGELGQGNTQDRGWGANQMGDNMPVVDLGFNGSPTPTTAISVNTANESTCALLSNNTMKCWGRGDWGTLGQGNAISHGDQPNTMGDTLPAISVGAPGTSVVDMTTGVTLSPCAVMPNAMQASGYAVKCWGLNDSGQLGLGDVVNRGNAVNQMGINLPIVNTGF